MSTSVNFSFVKFQVADIQAIFANNPSPPVSNFVFAPFIPSANSFTIGLMAYAQTVNAGGGLQYTGVGYPLVADSANPPVSSNVELVLSLNYISAVKMQKLIANVNANEYLLFSPSLIPDTNFIKYDISIAAGLVREDFVGDDLVGDDNGDFTNPSPPATMPS